MVKLELCKGLSYNGIVSATRESPFVKTDNVTAQKAVETGYFKVVQETKSQTSDMQEQVQETIDDITVSKKKPIYKMNKSELLDLALEWGVDVSAFKNLDEVRTFLKEFMESMERGSKEEIREEESEPDFGEGGEEV